MADFRFNASTHVYTCDGAEVPSVTDVLHAAGKIDSQWYTEHGRDRGTDVHRMLAEYDLGSIEPELFHGIYRGHLLGYVHAMAGMMPVWERIEEPLLHEALWLAGTPDRIGVVNRIRTVMDIKTGGEEDWHRLQTALYAVMIAGGDVQRALGVQRLACYVSETGRVRVVSHPNPGDIRQARGLLRSVA